jgi:hypothetical protein
MSEKAGLIESKMEIKKDPKTEDDVLVIEIPRELRGKKVNIKGLKALWSQGDVTIVGVTNEDEGIV